jgi:acyl CoA:acetate/3-ketoacid CoA transferase alpha subunit
MAAVENHMAVVACIVVVEVEELVEVEEQAWMLEEEQEVC